MARPKGSIISLTGKVMSPVSFGILPDIVRRRMQSRPCPTARYHRRSARCNVSQSPVELFVFSCANLRRSGKKTRCDRKMKPPKELRVSKDRLLLTVTFADEAPFELPAEMLRVLSPSAEVQGHSP